MKIISLTSITSFMTGVHLERLYVCSWERSRLDGLREKKLGWKQEYEKKNNKQDLETE